MEKAFRPIPLKLLARWVFGELDSRDTVLGIPKGSFARPDPRFRSTVLGQSLAAPLGVAAGPHSQLAQNIVASWLCGARFIELKTVQVLDELEVSRPCIDAADETYNCEWSQELKLEQSFDEYLKAWVLIHALARKLELPEPGTLFAMSVGYNLEGIRSPRVQRFIASIRDAAGALPAAVDAVAEVWPGVRDVAIPARLSNHITLSTMHGCPPAEIERIALYLLEELGVDTWVKLNPTLLGPERLRGLLNGTLGYGIEVPDAAFGHDPKFEDALPMVKRLAAAAKGAGRAFGVKLSNTLEVVNHRPVFPATEKMMYMSGRALHPLTLTLARIVDDELDGAVPISFCGGADAWNFGDLVADGVAPITVCTDLLKPGGYARLSQYLENLGEAMDASGAQSLDGFVAETSGGRGRRWNLARHAERVVAEGHVRRYGRRDRPLAFKGSRPLGPFDCIAAPCMEACPAHQNIPDYLWLVAHGRSDEAIEVIRRSNALPGVTGSICDHPCTERCVRNLYDTPLGIREIKRFAFENGVSKPEQAAAPKGVKVAIVGAGPAGISAALNLARVGIDSELFEAKEHAGGMVGGAVPRYRLDDEKLKIDLERLTSLGVKIHTGTAVGRDVTLDELRAKFSYVFLGVGAQKGKRLGIPGEEAEGVFDALEFLDGLREGVQRNLGRRVLVVGGGNSAMDGARSARRLVPDGEVSLVYRRTRAEMPADPAEVRDCEVEGIGLHDLLAPARVVVENGRVVGLACTRMMLGPPDASGRPRPVPVDGSEVVLPADTIVTAIGQEPALEFLGGPARREEDGTPREARDGGDVASRDLRRRRRLPRPRFDHQGGCRRPGRGRGDREAARRTAGRRAAPCQGTAGRRHDGEEGAPPSARARAGAAGRRARRLPGGAPLPRRRGGAPRGLPVPRLRRGLQPLRHRLPEPGQPRVLRPAALHRAAVVRRGGRAGRREGDDDARRRTGDPDRQPRRRLQRVWQLRHLLPDVRSAVPRQADVLDRPGRIRRSEGGRLPDDPHGRSRGDRRAGCRPLPPPRGRRRRRPVPLGSPLRNARRRHLEGRRGPGRGGRRRGRLPRPRYLRPPDRAAPRGARAPAHFQPPGRRRRPLSPRRENMAKPNVIHPVDEVLPPTRLTLLGLQHVLVMYAGAVAVPLIVGGALKLPKDQMAMLINADLFACGIATLVQSIGFWRFGIRLPVMMGVTFAAVSPMVVMATNPEIGLLGIYGAVIVAGIFGILVAPLISRMLPLFPPVVTGSIITIIGISLMRVGVNWAAGGNPMIKNPADMAGPMIANPAYGAPLHLAVAGIVLVFILVISKFVKGFFANIAVLLGLVVGMIIAMALGKVSFAGLSESGWFAVVYPFQFGMPTFDLVACLTMCMVMVVVMIESLGMFLAVGNIVGKEIRQSDLSDGLRVDGLGTLIGGIFNTFPYTSFSQNVGLVGVTGVKSRWVTALGGVILLALGLVPKLAVIVASVPQFVLGGAGIVMFGMVCATGIRILGGVDFAKNRLNLYIVALSIGFGMIPLVAEKFFSQMPKGLSPLLHSGILLCSIVAVALNAFFNHLQGAETAAAESKQASAKAEA
jgi:putative selenate reductase